ncbi:hypothetical protein BVIET440_120180 [Burkholderia vietnamiensis]
MYVELRRRRACNWGCTAGRAPASRRGSAPLDAAARANGGIGPPTGYHVRDAFFAAMQYNAAANRLEYTWHYPWTTSAWPCSATSRTSHWACATRSTRNSTSSPCSSACCSRAASS